MLAGHLDHVGFDRITGWARDVDDPTRRLALDIFDGDNRIVRIVADKMRTDLAKVGMGDGLYGFWLQVPSGLFPMPVHRISVRFAETGADIEGSPRILYRPDNALDPAFIEWVEGSVSAAIPHIDDPDRAAPLLDFSVNLLGGVLARIDSLSAARKSTALSHADPDTLPDILKRSVEHASAGLKPVHVPHHAAPAISVIVASSGRPSDDIALLRSVVQAGKGLKFEAILVDGSGMVETAVLPLLIRGGARLVRISEAGGVLAAFSEGARVARGRWLFFLNEVQEISADAIRLLALTMEREGEDSLIAPRLLSGDRLAAAGFALDSLGNRSGLGQGTHREQSRFQILRAAADVPFNAFMIGNDLLRQIGGLDAAGRFMDFASAHLSQSVRAAGGKVLVQGACDAVLSGRIIGHTTKGKGRSAFLARWSADLPGVGTGAGAGLPRNVLMVDERLPNSDEDAASEAILSHAQAFRRLGFHVEFVSMSASGGNADQVRAIRALGIDAHFPPDNLQQFIASRAGQFDVVYCHRHKVARQVLKAARAGHPDACLIYGVADLHHLRLERQRAITGGPDPIEIDAVKAEEFDCIRQADVTLTHSDFEAGVISSAVPSAQVAVLPWAVNVSAEHPDSAGRRGVCFLGSYRHAPNVDAITHFLADIWSLVPGPVRDNGLYVAGAHSQLLSLGPLPPRVTLVGHVKSVAGFLADKRLMVAPLRFGAGVKGKVISSLALGLPCIMSPMAAEGIALSTALREALVAEDADSFAGKIALFSTDDALWASVANEAADWARQALSEETVTTTLGSILADWEARRRVC